jgi:hypothetical protein
MVRKKYSISETPVCTSARTVVHCAGSEEVPYIKTLQVEYVYNVSTRRSLSTCP